VFSHAPKINLSGRASKIFALLFAGQASYQRNAQTVVGLGAILAGLAEGRSSEKKAGKRIKICSFSPLIVVRLRKSVIFFHVKSEFQMEK
jgi:hypothetical protein